MRARYYSPDMRRFISADILPGGIDNAVTLNRYAYANANPVTNIDPFGLCAEESKYLLGSGIYNRVSTVNFTREFDLSFGGNIVKVTHQQMVSGGNVIAGWASDIFEAYFFSDSNISTEKVSLGMGIELLNLLNAEIAFKKTGITAKLTLNNDYFGMPNTSGFIALDIDLGDMTSISIGNSYMIGEDIEVENNYSFEVDTTLALELVAYYFFQQDLPLENKQPAPLPAPQPGYAY